MRGRAPLLLSLVLNAALLAVLWSLLQSDSEPATPVPGPGPAEANNGLVRTNVVVRRQNFVWSDVESEDYPTYIANLRLIGCPESTIRDIIVAEVTQMFARRRTSEVVTASQQWWRSEPDPAVAWAAVARIRELEDERRALLSRLLGPEWESMDYPLPSLETLVPLDGAVLGALSAEMKRAVQRIEREALQRQSEYLAAREAAGEQPDPAELARLRAEARGALAAVLPPEALEEYLLRYSQEATDLRRRLAGVDTSPEEFRALFRAIDPLGQELGTTSGAGGADSLKRRSDLEQERERVLRQVLGEERYEEYRLVRNPLYQQARGVAAAAGVPDDRILPLAAIYRLTEIEEAQIRNDTSLSPDEKAVRLEAMRIAQQESVSQLLGAEGYQRYLNSLRVPSP
ncbi:MAG: hypothetical protein KJ072_19045 [Verrucomicrobia bacterium]|nr:hypothetical protein [Verrucomicrobiota bacterium]